MATENRRGDKPSSEKMAQMERNAYLRARGVDPSLPMQLDIWPNDMRAIPNDYARSALFMVRGRGQERATMQGAVLFHVDKAVTVTYTGIELRAEDDQLVWQQIIHYARELPLGEPVTFSTGQILADIGWKNNGAYYQKVRDCIERLKANSVRVSNVRLGRGVGVSLIARYEFDKETASGSSGALYTVWIDPDLMVFFAGQNYTRVAWVGYRELSPVARRLHDYIASHKAPYPLPLQTFHLMCGSRCSSERKWTQMVKKACLEVQGAGLVKSAWVDSGRVVIEG